jgi:hypothetical protein
MILISRAPRIAFQKNAVAIPHHFDGLRSLSLLAHLEEKDPGRLTATDQGA